MIPLMLQLTNYAGAQNLLLPLVIVALLLDSAIISVWYFAGSLLNRNTIKEAAIGEFYQFIGTVLIISMLLVFVIAFGQAFYSTLSSTTLNPTFLHNTCSSITSNTGLDLLGSTNSLLMSGNTLSPGICDIANGYYNPVTAIFSSSLSPTMAIDYPLVASSVLVANITEQTSENYAAFYQLDAFVGFLSKLSPFIRVCIETDATPTACIAPDVDGQLFDIKGSYTPYAGYTMVTSSMNNIGNILSISLELSILQIILLLISINIWPYLLFIGIVFRSTFFTRKIGGLLIAIALGMIFLFPLLYSMEYIYLGGGAGQGASLTNLQNVYNFNYNTITLQSFSSNTYQLNFFVEPSIQQTAILQGCYPKIPLTSTSNIGLAELADVGYTMIPGASLISSATTLISHFLSNGINFFLPVNCPSNSLLNTFFAMTKIYGIIGVIGYFIPLINILITLTGIIGLSQLFGGDTKLAGIGRLI